MLNELISHHDIPDMGETTKKMITKGIWHLYKVCEKESAVRYALFTDENVIYFNNSGEFMRKNHKNQNKAVFEREIYFKDSPIVNSLNSYKNLWA